MKNLVYSILLVVSLSSSAGAEDVIKLLENSRSEIKFLPLSQEEKLNIIKDAKILFSKIYVNLEHKMALYKVDPLNELENLERSQQTLSEDQFHLQMIKIFNSLEDDHTHYFLPKPYSCYSASLPLYFNKLGGHRVIVRKVQLEKKDIFPEIIKISPGDELISYNNTPVAEAIRSRKFFTKGSTPDAKFLKGVLSLDYRPLLYNIIPDEDFVQLKLRRVSGEIYQITVPWLSILNPDCLNSNPQESSLENAEGAGISMELDLKRQNKFWKYKFLNNKKIEVNSINKSLDQNVERVDISNLDTSEIANISWKKISYQNENFGYLKLADFWLPKYDDLELGIQDTLNDLVYTLSNDLADTSGLIIDLRGNPGGHIDLAEPMAALFSPMAPKAVPFYIRANELINPVFNEMIEMDDYKQWKRLILNNIEKNNIVGPANITSQNKLINTSQVYFGKVVLLTNGECVSACEVFTLAMKENARSIIYGTEHSTFGGIANVFDFEGLLAPAFAANNLPNKLPQNMGMAVTARHARSFSTNAIMDDKGVRTDILVTEDTQDIINPEKSSLISKIIRDLIATKNLKKSSDITMVLDKDIYQSFSKKEVNLDVTTANINQVSIYLNNKFLKRINIGAENGFSLNLPLIKSDNIFDVIEIFGFNKEINSSLPILRKSILVESLPEFRTLDTFDPIEGAVIRSFPHNPDNQCGWQRNSNELVLAGPYCPNKKMEINELVELSEGNHNLSFDLKLDLEKDYDLFEVVVISDGVEESLLGPISEPTENHFDLSLEKYAGKKINIKMRMTSDWEYSGEGITISNLEIK